jgi:hypothetical protein
VAVSEQSHALASEGSHTGGAPASTEGEFWRDATGWFRYEMKALPDQPNALRCAYWGSDNNRTFDILVDGKHIATERLTGNNPGNYRYVTYPISPELTRGKSRIQVEFRAAPGSTAGGVFDVRTVRPFANTGV